MDFVELTAPTFIMIKPRRSIIYAEIYTPCGERCGGEWQSREDPQQLEQVA